jgi:hypothetical protein
MEPEQKKFFNQVILPKLVEMAEEGTLPSDINELSSFDFDEEAKSFNRLVEPISYPIEEFDTDGNNTYFEDSEGYWCKHKYDVNGNNTYSEDSDGQWEKREFNADGNQTYYENSDGTWYKWEFDADGKHTKYEDSRGLVNNY